MIKKFEDFVLNESKVEKISLKDIAKDFEGGLPSVIAENILKTIGSDVKDAIKNESLDDKELGKVFVWVGRNFRYNLEEVGKNILNVLEEWNEDWDKSYPEAYITLYAGFPVETVFDEFEDGNADFVAKVTKRAKRYFPWNLDEGGKIKILDAKDW